MITSKKSPAEIETLEQLLEHNVRLFVNNQEIKDDATLKAIAGSSYIKFKLNLHKDGYSYACDMTQQPGTCSIVFVNEFRYDNSDNVEAITLLLRYATIAAKYANYTFIKGGHREKDRTIAAAELAGFELSQPYKNLRTSNVLVDFKLTLHAKETIYA